MYNKITQIRGRAAYFINLHWFKIGLACLVLYAFLNRNFSFKISIQAPTEIPVENTFKPASSKKETLTDNGLATTQASNQFDFWPRWSDEKKTPLIQQLQHIERTQIRAFIRRFSAIAQTEQIKFGIPASIILAHALLKSSAGSSIYVKEGANYFSLPCSDDWNGGTQDGLNGCIRRYDNAWQSFRDHSLYLTTGDNAGLRKIDATDYKSWAKAVAQLNEDENEFAKQLLIVMQEFGLH